MRKVRLRYRIDVLMFGPRIRGLYEANFTYPNKARAEVEFENLSLLPNAAVTLTEEEYEA